MCPSWPQPRPLCGAYHSGMLGGWQHPVGHLWSPENPDTLFKAAKSRCPATIPSLSPKSRVNQSYRHFGNRAFPPCLLPAGSPQSLEPCNPPATKQAFLARFWEVVSYFGPSCPLKKGLGPTGWKPEGSGQGSPTYLSGSPACQDERILPTHLPPGYCITHSSKPAPSGEGATGLLHDLWPTVCGTNPVIHCRVNICISVQGFLCLKNYRLAPTCFEQLCLGSSAFLKEKVPF